MTELGARLKEARVAKGYSLDDLQEMTKIQKRYLAGIEEGNYSTMPGPFYVRAFIKQYADAVGLDSDELLEVYKQDVPNTTNESITSSMSSSPVRRRPISKSRSKIGEIIPMILVAVFVIALIVVVWFLYQNIASKDDPKETNNSSDVILEENPVEQTPDDADEPEQEPADETPVVEEEPVDEPVQTIEVGTTQGQDTNYVLSNTDAFVIKAVAKGDSWLSIKDQNGKEFIGAEGKGLKAGETFELDVSTVESARIRVGSTPNVEVFINDEKVPYSNDNVTQNLLIQFNKSE
ncbi:helix-turn-helix domain-containing protein [Paenisporosarcina cavernae]|uniref:Helix-turn-helix domain-containing protein n=1 Tax=Paenisporosarcina cavernae TaxID=2320858 RepID=A0A385YUR3_9BACL|nr:helix-turn-helix domain-containing protein [Paenisporosarcina cavernae]